MNKPPLLQLLNRLAYRTGLGMTLSVLLAASPAWAAGGGAGSGAKPTTSTKDYDYYLTGNPVDVTPPKPEKQLLTLMGGGIDVDAAFQQMIDRASGTSGDCPVSGSTAFKVDVVIIRTSGADGYNDYLANQIKRGCKVDSVESIVIKTQGGANSDFVNEKVRKADVLFIAGGDQSTYIALWKGTKLDTTLQGLLSRNVPFGGTSAGLAVLGGVDYSGAAGSVTSSQALSDPYNKYMTFDTGFITRLPGLTGVITDAHLVTRDRMGRLITFLARMSADISPTAWEDARGIGIDEATAVMLDGPIDSQTAQVVGSGAAYFLKPTTAPTTLQQRKPLTFRSVSIVKRPGGAGPEWLRDIWSATTPYFIDADAGALTSNQTGGSVY